MTEQSRTQQNDVHAGETAWTSELFAELVLRQTQLALVLLGKIPHPESGKAQCDLDQARIAIDLLEMLELKTKGNLTKDEDALLKQSLMMLRMAFVEAAESKVKQAESAAQDKPTSGESAASEAKNAPAQSVPPDDQPRKRFVKKY